jgi:hypothetical protein
MYYRLVRSLLRGVLALVFSLLALPASSEAQECTFAIDNPTLRFGPAATDFSFRVNAGATCGSFVRQVSTTAAWLTPSSSAIPGNTSVILKLSVSANTTGAIRTANLLFDGQPVVAVTQGTTTCVTGVTPSSGSFPLDGGRLGFAVQTATADCVWAVTGFPPASFHGFSTGWAYPDGSNSQGIGGRPTIFEEIGSRGFAVAARSNIFSMEAQSATLTVGEAFTVLLTQPGATCSFTFTPATVTIPASGGSASTTLGGVGSDCTYSTSGSFGPVTVTAGQAGVAPAIFTVSMPANTTLEPRSVLVLVANARLEITQAASPVRVDLPGGLGFGVVRSGDGAIRVTTPEPLRITNDDQPSAAWTATASQPWIVLSPASGTSPATLRVSVDPVLVASLPGGFSSATIDIVSSIAPQSPRRIHVSLAVYPGVLSEPPIGVVDTPANGATGLSGAVAITGWAVDRVGINAVRIYRASVPGEPQGLIYVGDALRVYGSRPDLLMFFPGFPEARLGGWGYMLLSNVLPNGGNGTFSLFAYAEDLEGNHQLLGSTTVTFDNAAATRPFGTIDSPAQGETVRGTILNRGWVLTPAGKAIPLDGSTIRVYIDGALLSPVTSYNHSRPDVKAFFPGLANSDGPEPRLSIDTTTLADGVHTIAWGVIDDKGAAEGIGSRYFTVQNGSSSLVSAPADASRSAASVARLPILKTDAWSREGVHDTGWATRVETDAKGTRTLRVPRGRRVELFLDPTLAARCGSYEGHLVSGDVAGPLPAGASLDAHNGVFRWQPTAAFSGRFEFVFVQRGCDGIARRIPLAVFLEEGR